MQTSTNHAFRKRCHLVLLKADGRDSKDVGKIVKMNHVSVNSWLKRYLQLGINGLHTRPGRGRKATLDPAVDGPLLRAAVEENRQSLRLAKAEFEAQGGKVVSLSRLRVFLKSLVGATNA